MDPALRRIVTRVAALADIVPDVAAVGLSGSLARGQSDALSDIDLCLYTHGPVPDARSRARAYERLGLTERLYWDVDFETCLGDGFCVEGRRCDLIWMSIPAVSAYLRALIDDHDAEEWLPGGLSGVVPVRDPNDWIARLRGEIPPYSEDRARHRVERALRDARHALYALGWLQKAVARDDAYSFLKYEYELLDKLFSALFALNRVWYADEKRLTRRVASLALKPTDVDARLQRLIGRQGTCATMAGALIEIQALYRETAELAHDRLSDLTTPQVGHP